MQIFAELQRPVCGLRFAAIQIRFFAPPGQIMNKFPEAAPAETSEDARWMRLALQAAHEAAARGEVPVGAVVAALGERIAVLLRA